MLLTDERSLQSPRTTNFTMLWAEKPQAPALRAQTYLARCHLSLCNPTILTNRVDNSGISTLRGACTTQYRLLVLNRQPRPDSNQARVGGTCWYTHAHSFLFLSLQSHLRVLTASLFCPLLRAVWLPRGRAGCEAKWQPLLRCLALRPAERPNAAAARAVVEPKVRKRSHRRPSRQF